MPYDESLTEEELEHYESLQDGTSNYGYPTPPTKDSIFKFFRELLRLPDSSKIANLDKLEIGMPKISVRGLQNIALYAEKENLDDVAEYLRAESEITLATSLSRKAKLLETFVTQIKRERKDSNFQPKTGWFSKNKEARQP